MRIDGLAEDVVKLELARRQFRRFISATKPDYHFNWHHEVLCSKLELFVAGEISHLMVFMGPRVGKTELCSRRLPAYVFGKDPNRRIILGSYGEGLSSTFNRDVQRIMDSPAYLNIFPDSRLPGRGAPGDDGTKVRNNRLVELIGRDGSLRVAGVDSTLTGTGADILIIDDPIKNRKEADSITKRNHVWEWFGDVAETRLEKDAQVLLIMTRWHEDDLAGRLLNLAKNDPDAQQWDVVSFPSLKEGEPNEIDPRQEGEALWPEKFSKETLEKRKKTMGTRRFSAIHQQAPTPVEGSIIKRAWCGKFWKALPSRIEEMLISVDCTFKDTANTDFVVMDCWARTGADKFLVDQVRDRMDFPTTVSTLQAFCAAHPKAYVKLIEDKANGPAVISTLKKKVSGLIAVDPQGSKDERLSAVSPDFEAGNIWLPHPDQAPWIHDWIEELCTNGAHDDRKDTCSQALLRFRGAESSDFPDDPKAGTVRTIGGIKKDGVQW